MEEVSRLKRDWMGQEREIEWLRKELERAKREVMALKEDEYKRTHGWSQRLTRSEEEEMDALWACYGK